MMMMQHLFLFQAKNRSEAKRRTKAVRIKRREEIHLGSKNLACFSFTLNSHFSCIPHLLFDHKIWCHYHQHKHHHAQHHHEPFLLLLRHQHDYHHHHHKHLPHKTNEKECIFASLLCSTSRSVVVMFVQGGKEENKRRKRVWEDKIRNRWCQDGHQVERKSIRQMTPDIEASRVQPMVGRGG